MIFYVKLDYSFTCKAILVVNGNKVDTLPSMTYTSLLSRYSVSIVLMLDTLDGLCLQCTDVQKSYLNSNLKQKVLFYASEEFSNYKGKLVIVIRTFYGLKGVGSTWEVVIHNLMGNFGFRPFWVDYNTWMHSEFDTSIQGEAQTENNARPSSVYVLGSLLGASTPQEDLPVGEQYWNMLSLM